MNNLELKFLAVDSQLELFSNFFPQIHDSEAAEKLTTEIHHVLANSTYNLPNSEPVVELENKTLRQIILGKNSGSAKSNPTKGKSGSSSGKSIRLPIIPSFSTQNGSTDEEAKIKKIYKCKLCDKPFQFPSLLKSHITTHGSINQQQLEALKPKSKIYQHQRKILGYNCSVCGKSYNWRSSLLYHMITHGGNESRRKCDICNNYIHPNYMKTHKLIHTGVNPFKCLVCNKSFPTSSKLGRHKIIHTAEKPHSCIFCKKTFNQPSNLNQHLLIHTGEKPYECSVCEMTFRQKVHLTSHMKKH